MNDFPTLNYTAYGDESNPSLFIMHGLFGSSDNWKSLSKRFAKNFHVIAIDLRNHGNSFHSDDMTYKNMSNDIFRLLKHLKIKKTHIIGHSMGGKAAMTFSSAHPNHVHSQIIVDMAPKQYPRQHDTILNALNNLPLTEIHSRQEALSFLLEKLKDEALCQFLLKNFIPEPTQSSWKFDLNTLTRQYSEISAPPEVSTPSKTPSLFIKGELSNYINNEDITLIQKMYPQAVVKTIPNASHWVQAESPSLFHTTCLEFLLTNR